MIDIYQPCARCKYCCTRFAHEAEAQFEYDADSKTWNVNGCCGGGCYVVTGMRFCPFCGTRLTEIKRATAKTT